MSARLIVVAAIAACVFLPAASAPAVVQLGEDHAERPDFDSRTGSIAPTAAQRDLVRGLDARAGWNRFGTPSSLVRHGGYLANSVAGGTAVAAARNWLSANRRLFRLSSIEGLEVMSDSGLSQSRGHAVSFRQTFGRLEASDGGLVTVGLTRGGGAWRVGYVSSTITGDETIAGQARINIAQAWQTAARSVGKVRSLAQIQRVSPAKQRLPGWELLEVTALADVQSVREVAFPTIRRGVVPAHEALVVDNDQPEPEAYRVFVDARTGRVLARQSLVDHSHEGPSPVFTFEGALPAADGGCDVRKGPYTVAADDHIRAIDVFAGADHPLQDIVLNLYFGDTRVAEADQLRTPERIRYAPSGGPAPGDYFVEVCEFDDNEPPVEPRTYQGTVTLDNTAAPAPYLARWKVFPANPPLATMSADPWGHPNTDTRERWCWRAAENECDRVVGNLAARAPWDHDVKANLATSTTIGNNAVTAESWTHQSVPSPTQFRPVSATRDYSFPWANTWSETDCNPGTPYGTAFVRGQSPDVPAAVTNLFVMHNRMHDWSYNLGFTEENWNGQASNFGLTEAFRENDPVVGDAQAGALIPPPNGYGLARDNANMNTLPEGQSSVTNMYLWQPLAAGFYAPCVDGDFDMSVIGHEYTHMIENRMIGKGFRRSGHHAGAMGESHSDLLAIEYLLENGFVPTSNENPFAVGPYVTGQKRRGIRNYAGNFPATGAFPQSGVYSEVDPLNFSDIGYDLTGPQVHADGELWTATNIDIRKALVEKYNGSFPESDAELQRRCADGALPPASCPGNRRWIQLVLDAFLLMPTAPSMIDARNAMLAADVMRFGGANQSELWLAFARRGLGQNASSTNTVGRAAGVESDTDPLPDWGSPRHAGATVTFRAIEQGNAQTAVPARIYVGHYEARVSPVADTNPATNAPAGSSTNNLDEFATFAPGAYEFVATAPGYGHVRFRQTLEGGTAPTVTLRFEPNVASAARGATASGDVAPLTSPTSQPPGAVILTGEQVLRRLIDETEETHWQAAATDLGGTWNVAGKQATVDLAGSQPEVITRVQVSAALGPVFDPNATPNPSDLTQNRFTALRQFDIWACNANRRDCSADAGFERVFTSAENAFPGDAPRPVQPQLILREFEIPRTRATHLRLVVRTSQCTGAPDYQGEQDADPFNATDCDTAGGASSRFVRVAELQAFRR
jgi:extracellular elastinolytic metalloproteinase